MFESDIFLNFIFLIFSLLLEMVSKSDVIFLKLSSLSELYYELLSRSSSFNSSYLTYYLKVLNHLKSSILFVLFSERS